MMEDTDINIDVHFSCQRCCQPLRLDPSLNPINKEYFFDLINARQSNVNETETNKLSSNSNNEDDRIIKGGEQQIANASGDLSLSSSPRKVTINPKVICKTIQPIRKVKSRVDCDYSLIDEADTNGSRSTNSMVHSSLLSNFDQSMLDSSKDLKLQIQLFDILSDQSDIDHPLCEECADFVITQMDHYLKILEDECAEYSDYLKQLEDDETTTDEEIEKLRSKLKSMQLKQASMISELKELNKEQKRVDEEVERNMSELKRLKADEDKYWHEYNNVKFNCFQCEEELHTLENKYKYAKEFYNKLKNSNVFNSTFYIWFNGPFGTINGFRLGRTRSVQVEWNEINAAWGQCALLLYSLANKIRLTFERFKIVPYGNSSFIESLEDNSKQLPLHTQGYMKTFNYLNQKFDRAMVAFLDCLQQFNEEAHRQDPEFRLRYEMDLKGNIIEKDAKQNDVKHSIKYCNATDEKWTRTLKLMLTNLKWALVWVSNRHGD